MAAGPGLAAIQPLRDHGVLSGADVAVNQSTRWRGWSWLPTAPLLLVCLLLTALLQATAGRAQQEPAEGRSDTRRSEPQKLQIPEGYVSRTQLIKLPDWLFLGVSSTAEPMFNPIGGQQYQAAWIQQTTVALGAGTGLVKDKLQWHERDHWHLAANINQINGNPQFSSQIGAVFPLQQVSYPDGFYLSQASIVRHPGEGWFGLRAGVISLNPEFMSAPILNEYVHSAFNNTLNINERDLPINPYAALGGMVMVQPANDLSVRYGLFALDTVVPVARALGVQPSLAADGNGQAQVLQVNYTPAWLGGGDAQILRTCRSNGRLVPARPQCPDPVELDSQLTEGLLSIGGYTTSSEGNGVFGSITFSTPLRLGLGHRFWLGGSASTNDDTDIAPRFVGGGLVSQGVLPGRPFDKLVFGLGRSSLNPAAETDPPILQSYEGMAELGYAIQVSTNLSLQPTLQWIFNPGLINPSKGIGAAGLQISLTF